MTGRPKDQQDYFVSTEDDLQIFDSEEEADAAAKKETVDLSKCEESTERRKIRRVRLRR